MAEGKMTADQKGHLTKRQAAAPPAAAAPSVGKDIKLPGGNTISHDRPPYLTVAQPNGLKTMGGSDWPEFNDVLLKSAVATIPNTDPDAVPQRVAAVSAALAAFKPTERDRGHDRRTGRRAAPRCDGVLPPSMLPGPDRPKPHRSCGRTARTWPAP